MSKETPTMKKKRKDADTKWRLSQKLGYRKKLWESGTLGTYRRAEHGELG